MPGNNYQTALDIYGWPQPLARLINVDQPSRQEDTQPTNDSGRRTSSNMVPA
jgi:hypothetical protein